MALAAPDAEQAVIGGIITAPGSLLEIRSRLPRPAVFADQRHQRIWMVLLDMADVGALIDLVTLSERLEDCGLLDQIGGLTYLAALSDAPPAPGNIVAYADIVYRHWQRRELARALTKHLNDVERADPRTLAAEIALSADRIAVASCESYTSMVDAIAQTYEQLERAVAARQHGAGTGLGLPSGVAALDHQLGGYDPGRFIVIAGPTSVGKTALSVVAAAAALDHGCAVGVFTLEMPATEWMTRLFCNRYGVNVSYLSRGDAKTFREMDNAYQAAPLSRLPLVIDDATATLPEIAARIGEWVHREQVKLIIVDHLQLVEGGEGQRRVEQLDAITRALKRAAKRHDIAVLALSQLSRSAEKEKRKPTLSDLRDGGIEHNADVVVMLYPESDFQHGIRTLGAGVLKNRGGPVGWMRSWEFDGRRQRFDDGTAGVDQAAALPFDE